MKEKKELKENQKPHNSAIAATVHCEAGEVMFVQADDRQYLTMKGEYVCLASEAGAFFPQEDCWLFESVAALMKQTHDRLRAFEAHMEDCKGCTCGPIRHMLAVGSHDSRCPKWVSS